MPEKHRPNQLLKDVTRLVVISGLLMACSPETPNYMIVLDQKCVTGETTDGFATDSVLLPPGTSIYLDNLLVGGGNNGSFSTKGLDDKDILTNNPDGSVAFFDYQDPGRISKFTLSGDSENDITRLNMSLKCPEKSTATPKASKDNGFYQGNSSKPVTMAYRGFGR